MEREHANNPPPTPTASHKDPSAPQTPTAPGNGLPPGDHALEIAARAGFGPLSPLARNVWHGDARPCVSCGQLVRRNATECAYCGQDLQPAMIDKMRAHAGPWYVLEHVRPFPGVSFERILRQVRRGLITETSIVRGPSTDHQWRFAVEVPGLSRFFGRCWNCREHLSPADHRCRACGSDQVAEPRDDSIDPPLANTSRTSTGRDAGQVAWKPGSKRDDQAGVGADAAAGPRVTPQPTPVAAGSPELRKLSAAIHQADLPAGNAVWDEPPRIAGVRATWIAALLLVVVIVALLFLTGASPQPRSPSTSSAPALIQPQP